jgi:DNA-binding transcriptional regulator GbsR (MarR family)
MNYLVARQSRTTLPRKKRVIVTASATRIRTDTVTQFERGVVEFFVNATEGFGVPRSVAGIYGVIFASARPLCFGDIETRLGISKGSISQGLRLLADIGAIKAVKIEGDRRDFFKPDMQLRKLIQRFLDNRLQIQLDAAEEQLTRIVRQVPQTDTELLSNRFTQLIGWHAKARALLPVAKTFLKLGG